MNRKKDYNEIYDDFWKKIVENPDGTLNIDQVKRELFDFYRVIDYVPKVYCHITNDQVSKILTDPDTIISLVEDCVQGRIDDEIQDLIECEELTFVDKGSDVAKYYQKRIAETIKYDHSKI